MEEIKEIIDAIRLLNRCELEYGFEYPADLITDGWEFKVMWQDVTLWRSDEDEREFLEEKNTYEPLGPFLLKKQLEALTKMHTIIQSSLEFHKTQNKQ